MKLVGERTIEATRVEEVKASINNQEMSKGAGIRELFAGGLSVKEIAAETGIRYNHVYNVVKNEVVVHGLEVEVASRSNENSKKNQILELLGQGKTITEVSKELKCLYNYVWQIAKAGGFTQKQTTEVVAEASIVAEPKKSKSKKAVVA